MAFIKKTVLSISEKREILELWNNEFPKTLNFKTLKDFENYLATLTEQSHILMSNDNKDIKGWYFDFIRDNKKWFAIILDSDVHGLGFGTQILNIAKEKELELYGWVIDHNNDKKQNGESYKSPLSFYIKNGFEVLLKNRLELDLISAVQVYWTK